MGFPGQRAPHQVHRVSLPIPSSIINSSQPESLTQRTTNTRPSTMHAYRTRSESALVHDNSPAERFSSQSERDRTATQPSKAIFQGAMYRRVVLHTYASQRSALTSPSSRTPRPCRVAPASLRGRRRRWRRSAKRSPRMDVRCPETIQTRSSLRICARHDHCNILFAPVSSILVRSFLPEQC